MSKVLLIFMFVFLLLKLDAQIITENRPEQSHPFYLGMGTGIDNFTGFIGVSGTLRVYDKLSVRGGYGVGGWGLKSSIGLKYDLKEVGGWSYCLGYSYSSGLENLKQSFELESGDEKDIAIDYLSCQTINLAVDRNWRIGKANLFYLELGYSVPLQSNRWRVTDGSALSGTSKTILNSLQPGGLILGAGFAFKIFD
ncbi:MAG: hypothetical protein Q8N05_06255 [Bacteroidota bacterium]|nr:hypothetical protein [Bacteroidota bacterium]